MAKQGMIRRFAARQGRLITASLALMAAGLLIFVLTIPLYAAFNIDTDLLGMTIFSVGLGLLLAGIVRRNRLTGWKRAALLVLAAALVLPLLPLVVSLVYYLITGDPLGV